MNKRESKIVNDIFENFIKKHEPKLNPMSLGYNEHDTQNWRETKLIAWESFLLGFNIDKNKLKK